MFPHRRGVTALLKNAADGGMFPQPSTMGTDMGMAATITATGTLITLITTMATIMDMVTGGMVGGGTMASATAGFGRPTAMSGSAATTDYPLRPSGFPDTTSNRHGFTECT